MIKLAQIGVGYWGPNLLRNFYIIDDVMVKKVVDLDSSRLEYIKKNYEPIAVGTDIKGVLDDKDIDAVIIATPAGLHYGMVKEVLLSGKHCFVEKPLALKSSEAEELIKIARENDLILMIGHVFLYNAAVNYLKEFIGKGELGKIYYMYTQRLNLGRIRSDVNVLWNLAPHDISIILYLMEKIPVSVSASGMSYIQSNIEDVVFMNMKFDDGTIVHSHVSWLDPKKVRTVTIIGSKKMVIYDDISDNKIKIFDKGIDINSKNNSLGEFDNFGKFQLIKRAGDIYIPKIDFTEPLKAEASHFIDCINKKKNPVSDGLNGLIVTRIIEAALKSLEIQSREIEL
ncbi:MAG: Gfo/Idh/MocA family oxidoreductase [Actinobacteria bacterium]|nr:Gfo/Idh/MocA family oxidoreductase [Actinomycetota bacterium]